MTRSVHLLETILLLLGLMMVTGCATVRPWEREYLADRTMTFDAEGERDKLVCESREGSAGGAGAGGGGCACK